MIRKILFTFCICIAFTGLKAQNGFDVHFTQNHLTPVTLNPALTGAFYGTVRVGGLYRDQWSSFLTNQFTTTSVFADVPLLTGFKENDWIGVGISIYSDEAGAIGLRHNSMKASIAYHLALDDDGFSLLSFGIQGGFGQRSLKDINNPLLRFEEEILNNGAQAMERNRLMEDGQSFFDIGAGVAFSTVLSDNSDFNLGLSAAHFTAPEISLLGDREKISLRMAGHAKLNLDLSSKITVSPAVYFQSMAGSTELQLQGILGYLIDPVKDITLNLGLGYRLSDALQFMVGVDYGDLRAGIAYDLTNSELNPTSAFELAVTYIFKIYAKPNIKPAVLCPRL
jgi:type IX secretion system PorP/SprF family membrane protein